MCRKNLPGNGVHTDASKVAFETLKSLMISAPVLLMPKMENEAELVVATNVGKVGIFGVLLQEDTSGSLRPCAYWARKLKYCETRCSTYDRESLKIEWLQIGSIVTILEYFKRLWGAYLQRASDRGFGVNSRLPRKL
jgi:hypothetical protein